MQYLTLGTKIVGYINPNPKGFYLGLGISYQFISSESLYLQSETQSVQVKETTDTKVGLALIYGYLIKLKTTSILLESKYNFIQGGFNTFQLGVGINFYL